MDRLQAHLAHIDTTKCDEQHREDHNGRNAVVAPRVESHNLSAKYCARDHHRGHRNGFNGRIHRLCEMFRLRVQI